MKPKSPGLPALFACSAVVVSLLSGCPLSRPDLNPNVCTTNKDCFTQEGEICEVTAGASTGVCRTQFKDGSIRDQYIPVPPTDDAGDAEASDGPSDAAAGDSDTLGTDDGAGTGDGTIHQPESGTDAIAADAKQNG